MIRPELYWADPLEVGPGKARPANQTRVVPAQPGPGTTGPGVGRAVPARLLEANDYGEVHVLLLAEERATYQIHLIIHDTT